VDPGIAYCGLDCTSCPIHRATQEADGPRRESMRAEIARLCNAHYGTRYAPADIGDCDGCRSGGRLFFGCRDCRIRPCASVRGVATCAACSDYPCATLDAFLAKEPDARTRLDTLRRVS